MSAPETEVDAEKQKVPLDADERREVRQRRSMPAKVVHEVVRRQGIEELERPWLSLMWSGIAAGVCIGASPIGVSALTAALPVSPIQHFIASFGYSLGFIIVILGRMQLFTESTVTAIIPLATHPTLASLTRTARLWGVVLLANFTGTLAFALFVHVGGLGSAPLTDTMIALSCAILERPPLPVFASAIPAGFLIATLVWALPSADGQKLWLILIVTSMIEMAHFSHIVAGSAEAWTLVLAGKASLGQVIVGFILPALAGNIVGGSALFAVLAHAQVRQEITPSS